MDQKNRNKIMLAIRKKLLGFRSRANKVAAEPFEFLSICDELEAMGETILRSFAGYSGHKCAIRRRVYTPQGHLHSALYLDSYGVPRMKNGKKVVLKLNLEPWTKDDAVIDRRLVIARAHGRSVW
jgi:hypothetical protein